MVFSSTTFLLLFLPFVLIVYYGLLRNNVKAKNAFLFFASLVFYAWGEPLFVLVMVFSIIANWLFGVSIVKSTGAKRKKLLLALAVVLNLSILFVFKYLTFVLNNVTTLLRVDSVGINIALPIGVSFFTFQGMSYVIDVYREKSECLKNVLDVGLYISFFPQLIAGPIVRYETIAYEIHNRKETKSDFYDGFVRFLIGLAKKVILANTFAIYADDSFAAIDSLSVGMSWIGAVAYTFQIFFDFSGYSDMAIGLGKMFGFHFSENFDYPYISASVTEFWRRWHISLGAWFRDYVYIPLGGSRVSKGRLILNLFAVWMLTGIWHGANWTFFVWGFMYFVLLCAEKLTGFDKRKGNAMIRVVSHVYTMFFVVIGWVIFRAESLIDAFAYIKAMLGFSSVASYTPIYSTGVATFMGYAAIAIIFSVPFDRLLKVKYGNRTWYNVVSAVFLICVFAVTLASIVSSSHNPFIYFNF